MRISDASGYEVGKYIYHITPLNNLPSIKKTGLMPKDGTSVNGSHFKKRLYFATSLIAAYDLSVNFVSHGKSREYLILRVNSECLYDYYKDPLFPHGIYVNFFVPYKFVADYIIADDLYGEFSDSDIENLYFW